MALIERPGRVWAREQLITRLYGWNPDIGSNSIEVHVHALRKKLADERSVPAYIVFGDTTLRAMARHYPATLDAMEGIPGMGEKKRAEFGELFATEIAGYLSTHSRQSFND